MSRSSEADCTRRGVGGAGSASPGTTIPPIAAGPVDGFSAVLPAASPAAEMPGFGLDTAGPTRFRTTGGWPSCEPPPAVALPRAHHLHVARPPVRMYENAARTAQRIKGRPKKRNWSSGFTPLSQGRQSRATASRSRQLEVHFGRSHGDSRLHMVTGRCHKNWHPPAPTSELSDARDRGPLPGGRHPSPLTAETGIPQETRSDASPLAALPSPPAPRASEMPVPPPIGEPTSTTARTATIGPRPTAEAGSG